MNLFIGLVLTSMLVNLNAQTLISQMFGEVPKLPAPVIERITTWLASEPEVMRRLIAQETDLADFNAFHHANNEFLSQRGIKNYSRSNYVFECPVDNNYFIKVSGPTNRFVNIIIANDKWPTTIKPDEYRTLRRVITYQTISALPTYFLYLRLKKETLLNYVYIPNTYLVHVPGREEILADGNYIIAQEKIPLVDPQQEERLLKTMTHTQLCELIRVICACGLWDTQGKIKFAADGRIVIVDLEQPNISNPLRGLDIDDHGRLLKNMQAGIDELLITFKDDYERSALIKKIAQPFLEPKN